MEVKNLFRMFNISTSSDNAAVEASFNDLLSHSTSDAEKNKLTQYYEQISTTEKRYIYELTNIKGFSDLSELDREIISQPNYIGPGQWLALLKNETRGLNKRK